MAVIQGKSLNQRGFTLVELIIVIVVIGILAAVAIPKLADVTGGATAAKDKATLEAVRTAWSVAAAKAGAAPTPADVVAQVSPACTGSGNSYTCSGLAITFTPDSAGKVPDQSAITAASAASQ